MQSSKSAERDRHFQQVLRQAIDLKAVERRDAMLALGHEPELIDSALDLLAREDERFLAGPARPAVAEQVRLPTIPGYRLLHSIGEGGMGRVFLAEEVGDTGRKVAIKMVRGPFADAAYFQRFALERQALARLNHPAIAQLYAADTTPAGQPFVVMEYVDGLSLNAYCDRHRLGIEQRLRLFLAICGGIEHAHRRLLLHRDVKPSNLLVTERDGEILPKIIDFGIAKALDQNGMDDGGVVTGPIALGTPAYMSPEALRPVEGPRDLDTRTDIYSLGVVLYELLIGARPHEEATDDPLLPGRIVNDEPVRPSSRWFLLDEQTREHSAAARGLEAAEVPSALNDLDWIVMKAIARDRDRRYGSVGKLAADVERYLDHQPIEARPPSLRYRLTCGARRHRTAMIAAGLVAISLVLGAFGATFGMLRAREAEELARAEAVRAAREAKTATRVTDLVVGLFSVADPEKGGPSTTMELGELLNRGSASIRQQLDDDPAIQARLMSVLGDIYRVVGDYERSREHLDQALELLRSDPESDAYRLGQTLNNLAVLDRQAGRFEDAAARLNTASKLWSEALGPDHPKIAGLLNNRGNVLREVGRYEEAAAVLERALAIWQRTLGPEDRNVGIAALNLGNVWNQLGRDEEALEWYRRAAGIFGHLLGPDHPHVALVQSNIADVLADLGRYEQAESMIREVRRIRLAVLGPEHDRTVRSTVDLGRFLLAQGKIDAAEGLIQEGLEKFQAKLGPTHPQVGTTLIELSDLRQRQGRFEQARALAERAVSILEGQFSDEEANVKRARDLLVAVRSRLEENSRDLNASS